jgi:hypothetical protein
MANKTKKSVRKLSAKNAALSTDAVRNFLIDGRDFSSGGTVPGKICFDKNTYRDYEIYVSLIGADGAYTLSADSFKAWRHRDPLWSNYYQFSWDTDKGILSVTTESGEILITRRQKNPRQYPELLEG